MFFRNTFSQIDHQWLFQAFSPGIQLEKAPGWLLKIVKFFVGPSFHMASS
jgi:hypothetical protein